MLCTLLAKLDFGTQNQSEKMGELELWVRREGTDPAERNKSHPDD